MKIFHHQSLLRYRWHLVFALLTFTVIGLSCYLSAKPVPNDLQSSTAIHEVSDYARDFEDNADDDSFFIIAGLFDQSLQLDWSVILNTFVAQSNVSWFAYRARSRSPPTL
ncbi:MAG: hypothetical protein ACMZ63_00380 [Methylotenera sp.]